MQKATHLVRLLIVSEDGSEDSHAIWTRLLKRTFTEILAPGCMTHRIDFLPELPEWASFVKGSQWKGRRKGMVQLARLLASELAKPDGRLVIHHVDGDCARGSRFADRHNVDDNGDRRERLTCENRALYERELLPKVRAFLSHPDRDTDRIVGRLIFVMPHCCVEAWLYQNLDELERIGDELPHPQALRLQVVGWRADRGRLDEIVMPKEQLSSLKDGYNRRLAEKAWPAEEVWLVEKSYHEAVEQMRQNADLMAALRRTAEPPADG